MKEIVAISFILTTITSAIASDITLSKSINKDLRSKIERDLNLIDGFKFKTKANNQTLKVLEINNLDAQTATDWLNQRVNYIVSENALSFFNLLFMKTIFVEKENIDYPNPNAIPYSIVLNAQKSFTVMSNIGTALYLTGKKQRLIYGMKISRGFLKSSEKVTVTSPRTGIIQIGEGLFAPELTINKNNQDALANSISRLGTFYHEARHSDGNGLSLGFTHAICPKGHDFEGQAACDENLNGPYTVGALMIAEMAKACEEKCPESDKETLKLLVIDSANRIMTTTRKGEISTDWDSSPESL